MSRGVTQRSIPLNGITAFLSQLRLVSVEGSKQSAARHPSRHIAEEARECGAILEMSSISSSSALMRPNLIFGYFVNFQTFFPSLSYSDQIGQLLFFTLNANFHERGISFLNTYVKLH